MASRGRGAAQRGARFERAVVGWLRDQWGLRAERIRSGRSTDAGDIAWPDSVTSGSAECIPALVQNESRTPP